MEGNEQVLAALAVEVGLRQVAIINAKTLLEIETEEIKTEIAEYQGLSLPYEVQLAEQKLATAQKKLELIPYLQDIITAEESLITAETANVALDEDLIDERLTHIFIKEEIAGLKEYLLTIKDALTSTKLGVAEKKLALATARNEFEIKAQGKITPTNDLVTAMTGLNAALQLYITKKGELVVPYLAKATKLAELVAPATAYNDALLATLPFIVALATKKAELVTPSLAKAAALALLIAPLQAKAAKMLLYAAELTAQNALEQEIKNIALDIENLKKVGIDADLAVLAERLSEGDYQKALLEENVILKTLSENNKADLMTLDAAQTIAYVTEKEAAQTIVVEKEKEAASGQVDSHYEVAQIKMDTRLDSTKTTIGARAGSSGSIEKISQTHASEKTQTADIAAVAKITSTLIHQIS